MSLLQHQDFAIHRIRSRYLHSIRDGVGDRLIQLNPLTAPGFRSAGWGNPANIPRSHSPPIGTSNEYFSAAQRGRFAQLNDEQQTTETNGNAGLAVDGFGGIGLGAGLGGALKTGEGKEQEEMEFAPGRVPLNDKIPMPLRPPTREEDISSDSDSEPEPEEESMHTLKFSKVPVRGRSDSSPIPSVRTGTPVFAGTPRTSEAGRMRAGSHGTFEFARRNANKAEEQRRRVHMRMDSDSEMSEQQRLRISVSSSDVVGFADLGFGDLREEDAGDDSDISDTLSSEFTETIDSNPIRANFLQGARGRLLQLPGSPALVMLHELPPARPISMVQPVSLLTQLLNKDPEDVRPLDQYNIHEGSGELRSIALKIFFPHRKNPLTPVELQVRREDRQPDGTIKETTVVNAIGFCLYMYNEEKMEPPLEKEQMNVNKWTMRMVDDGEADMDFPPLDRTKPLYTFVLKDRRGVQRGPAEFAICLATPEQFEENERVTPVSKTTPAKAPKPLGAPITFTDKKEEPKPQAQRPGTADTNTSITMAPPSSAVTTRSGPTRILRIFMNTVDEFAKSAGISVTADTTYAEALDILCRKKHLNKADYVLKVYGTTTIMSGDLAVDTLSEDRDLELIRKSTRDVPGSSGHDHRENRSESFSSVLRQVDSAPVPTTPFVTGSAATSGFAPVMTINSVEGTPQPPPSSKKKNKAYLQTAAGPDQLSSANYLKFTVWRRQPMSFINRHERTLAIDGEYVHIMPSENKTLFESPKTTSLHISSCIGCKTSRKAPSNFKIAVLKSEPREIKSYDFEAMNAEMAAEIVATLREKIEVYRLDNPSEKRR